MEFIFLIYGLAFFLLGFAILYYPKKDSVFHLAQEIHFLGWFGILHGINEWLDLLILVNALDLSFVWEIIRSMTLPGSFFALIYFGAKVVSTQKKNCRICILVTPVLAVLWGLFFLAGEHNQQNWDILSRYILCLPGATLTGMALLMYIPETQNGSNSRLAANLKVSGITFIAYAFLAGLIVGDADFFPASWLNYSLFSKSIGVPVQVFRTLCAILIAYNMIRVLEVFHLEMQQLIFNSQMRFQTVVNTAPVTLFIVDKNRTISFLEGKGLSGLDITTTDATGKQAEEVFAELPQLYQNSERVLSSGEEFTEVVSVRGLHYEIFFAPLKNEKGIVSGAIGVAIDVTEQKNAQSKLENYRAEMEKNKTLAAIGALSTDIADQITGPLQGSKTSLLRALRGLKKTIGAGEVKADIQTGIDHVSAAIKTLNGFCSKANIQTPSGTEPIDLYEIVERVVSVFSESAQHRMIRIMTEGADIFPVLQVSGRELEQVLYTFIQTIIRSMEGDHVRNLVLRFSVQEQMLSMKFIETCLGDAAVSEAQAATLRSKMLETGDEHDFGISVLKGIIEAYAGTISIVQPRPDEIRYEIQLPLAK